MAAETDFTISRAFPWGRSFEEYVRMFALSEGDLSRRILGCADGPAAFNAEMTRRNKPMVSCDPLYQFSAEQIRGRVEQTRDILIEEAGRNSHLFRWDRIGSPEELGRVRMGAMEEFLGDFPGGRAAGRYVNESLPRLGFEDDAFDLALCSHFLFLYSDEFTREFHLEAILEMCRVAGEVRIFPLVNMRAEVSVHLGPVMAGLSEEGFWVQVRKVDYEFQRGGNEMLCVGKRDRRG